MTYSHDSGCGPWQIITHTCGLHIGCLARDNGMPGAEEKRTDDVAMPIRFNQVVI